MPIVEPSRLLAPMGLTPQTVVRMNGCTSLGHLFFKGCCELESGTDIKETVTTNTVKPSCCSKSYFLQLGFQQVSSTSWERWAERPNAAFFFFFSSPSLKVEMSILWNWNLKCSSYNHCKAS